MNSADLAQSAGEDPSQHEEVDEEGEELQETPA
jgi:hypothetical protein